MAKTGKKITPVLKKVTNNSSNFPLDVNNIRTSISKMVQDSMAMPEDDPRYIVDSEECESELFSSKAMSDFFGIECGPNLYSTLIEFSIAAGLFTSEISQEDADNKAAAYFRTEGQKKATLEATCSTTFCNYNETRVFYNSTCAPNIPIPYPVTIPANLYCGTPELVESQVNAWFAANGQSSADAEGDCVPNTGEVIFYRVVGNPCTSEKIYTKLYYKASENRYFTDEGLTLPANMIVFLGNKPIDGFKELVNGYLQTSKEYPQCEVDEEVIWSDMGIPGDVSLHGSSLLACYPFNNIVVKYNLATGKNPTGVIIAGKTNNAQIRPANNNEEEHKWLNFPTLVEWNSSGSHFAVYSGGSYKSIKIFNSSGDYVAGTTRIIPDGEWSYKFPDNEEEEEEREKGWDEPIGNLVTFLSGAWVPTSMCFGENTDDIFNIFLGLYGVGSSYQIFLTQIFPKTGPVGIIQDSYNASLVYSVGGLGISNSIIRGMKINGSETVGASTYFNLVVVTPYSPSRSKKDDRFRYFDVHNIKCVSTKGVTPIITVVSATYTWSYKTNENKNGVWKNNLRAEVDLGSNQDLIIVIKSSEYSIDQMIWNTTQIAIPGIGAGTFLAAVVFPLIQGNSFLLSPVWVALLGSASWLGLIGVLAIGAIIIALLKPKLRNFSIVVLTSRYNYGGFNNVLYIAYSPGTIEPDSWITNNVVTPLRTIFVNRNRSSIKIYSLYSGSIIKQGAFNLKHEELQITI